MTSSVATMVNACKLADRVVVTSLWNRRSLALRALLACREHPMSQEDEPAGPLSGVSETAALGSYVRVRGR